MNVLRSSQLVGRDRVLPLAMDRSPESLLRSELRCDVLRREVRQTGRGAVGQVRREQERFKPVRACPTQLDLRPRTAAIVLI